MIESKLKAKNATVDSCFDLVGSRQLTLFVSNLIKAPQRHIRSTEEKIIIVTQTEQKNDFTKRHIICNCVRITAN